MYSTVLTGAVTGVCAYIVSTEVDIAPGLPAISMVGSLNAEVRESRERVMVALKNAGMSLPPRRITVNLSPADVKKEGTAFDLPIAVGILQSLELFTVKVTEGILFLGELGLTGEIKPVKGVLPIVRQAAREGLKECIVPWENRMEAALVPGIMARGCQNLAQLLCFLQQEGEERDTILVPCSYEEAWRQEEECCPDMDFDQVDGQENVKRAAQIAVAGFHNLLMVGPPGAGKTMIAKRIPGIMPPLSVEESLDVTSIYSVCGRIRQGMGVIRRRPFRDPHHSITQPALIGGGRSLTPGEISLAHRGVLFLDELPEFKREVLDSLRQPLEEGEVSIARINGNITYPCEMILVCAMNPCPCGYYPDRNKCNCTMPQIRRYMGKVSGPILDRIDLCVELQPVGLQSLRAGGKHKKHTDESREESVQTSHPGESMGLQQEIMRARKMQENRFAGTHYRYNADIQASDIGHFCALGQDEEACMDEIYRVYGLSARSYHRVLKVARTIADLDGEKQILRKHLLEAACYRPSDEYWM